MSGHSKWSTIKHQKAVTDAARGKLFSKLSKAITVTVKVGGGSDPDTNYKLKAAIDAAKNANMPKANVERAISKGEGGGENLEEVVYEGFGPGGVPVMIEVTTDNRNRSGQEIKNLLERVGGSMGGPGSVSFNFDPRGVVVVEKGKDADTQMLDLIDAGAEDIEEATEGVEAYTTPRSLSEIKDKIEEKGYKVISAELIQKPKTPVATLGGAALEKMKSFLEKIDDYEDVQKVFVAAEF